MANLDEVQEGCPKRNLSSTSPLKPLTEAPQASPPQPQPKTPKEVKKPREWRYSILGYLVFLVLLGGTLPFVIWAWYQFETIGLVVSIVVCVFLWSWLFQSKPEPESEKARRSPKAEYQGYLQSQHWRITRYDAKARAGRRCKRCGTTQDLQVHHLTYARKGFEHPDDLEVLCKRCHYIVHQN